MIDRDLVYRKITLITPDLNALEKLASRAKKDFLSDDVATAVAERYLERVIGRMIDINYHLITSAGEPPPKDYYLSFIQLSKRPNVLEEDFAVRIAHAAGLRNRIAHEYDDMDSGLLFEGMCAAVEDIPLYIKAVLKYIETQGKGHNPDE